MPSSNPYKLLQVPRDADSVTIAGAYERLFDQYEPAAEKGDETATRILDDLNEAYDTLLDPARRAELDARLAERAARSATTGTATTTRVAPPQAQQKVRTQQTRTVSSMPSRRREGGTVRSSSAARPRAVLAPARRAISPVFMILGGVLLFLVVVTSVFLFAKNSATPQTSNPPVVVIPTGTVDESNIQDQPTPDSVGGVSTKDPNAVVATVSGEPLYMRDLVQRNVKDLIVARNDPLMGNILAQGGITATRIIDVLAQDSLDKQINLQVILLQAKKEGLYPADNQLDTLVEQAKQTDLNGQDFKAFLAERKLTEDQYRANVVRSVVYAVMASRHAGAGANEEARTTEFINWICGARKSYDIKINLKFAVQNQPCTSGLPTDLPLTDAIAPGAGTPSNATQAPEPVETGAPSPGK